MTSATLEKCWGWPAFRRPSTWWAATQSTSDASSLASSDRTKKKRVPPHYAWHPEGLA